jgi:hypothetical protein
MAGAKSHIVAADNKNNMAWVEVRANAKPVSRVNRFIFIFKLFARPSGNVKFHHQSPLASAGKTEISAALVQPLFQMACKLVKRK